jgi:bacterioferritin (cytochrome b1)
VNAGSVTVHVDWLEAQLAQIKERGLDDYLTQRIRDGSAVPRPSG